MTASSSLGRRQVDNTLATLVVVTADDRARSSSINALLALGPDARPLTLGRRVMYRLAIADQVGSAVCCYAMSRAMM